jgi:hypothetical protein
MKKLITFSIILLFTGSCNLINGREGFICESISTVNRQEVVTQAKIELTEAGKPKEQKHEPLLLLRVLTDL